MKLNVNKCHASSCSFIYPHRYISLYGFYSTNTFQVEVYYEDVMVWSSVTQCNEAFDNSISQMTTFWMDVDILLHSNIIWHHKMFKLKSQCRPGYSLRPKVIQTFWASLWTEWGVVCFNPEAFVTNGCCPRLTVYHLDQNLGFRTTLVAFLYWNFFRVISDSLNNNRVIQPIQWNTP